MQEGNRGMVPNSWLGHTPPLPNSGGTQSPRGTSHTDEKVVEDDLREAGGRHAGAGAVGVGDVARDHEEG